MDDTVTPSKPATHPSEKCESARIGRLCTACKLQPAYAGSGPVRLSGSGAQEGAGGNPTQPPSLGPHSTFCESCVGRRPVLVPRFHLNREPGC